MYSIDEILWLSRHPADRRLWRRSVCVFSMSAWLGQVPSALLPVCSLGPSDVQRGSTNLSPSTSATTRHHQQTRRSDHCLSLTDSVASPGMGHWGTCPPWSLRMHANFADVQTMAVLVFLPSSVSSKLDRQSRQLLWQTVAKKLQPYSFLQT